MKPTIEINEANFQTEVLNSTQPVVVDFWAPWCGPCRMLAPVLDKLVAQRNGAVLLAKVNTDEQERLAMQYNIDSLPTVVAFRDGKPILDFVGVLPEAELQAFLDRLAPSAAEQQVYEATKLEKSDPAKAEQLYRQALQGDSRLETAQIGLARLLIQRD